MPLTAEKVAYCRVRSCWNRKCRKEYSERRNRLWIYQSTSFKSVFELDSQPFWAFKIWSRMFAGHTFQLLYLAQTIPAIRIRIRLFRRAHDSGVRLFTYVSCSISWPNKYINNQAKQIKGSRFWHCPLGLLGNEEAVVGKIDDWKSGGMW